MSSLIPLAVATLTGSVVARVVDGGFWVDAMTVFVVIMVVLGSYALLQRRVGPHDHGGD
jgi:hypothetical protein